MGGGASSSLHACNLRLGATSRCKLLTTPANPQAEGGACRETELARWGHGNSPAFCGELARNPGLQDNHQLHDHSLGVGSRQKALRSPSPQDLGRSQASQAKSQSSHPAPVSIGAWVEECELCRRHDHLRRDMQSLRECMSMTS